MESGVQEGLDAGEKEGTLGPGEARSTLISALIAFFNSKRRCGSVRGSISSKWLWNEKDTGRRVKSGANRSSQKRR